MGTRNLRNTWLEENTMAILDSSGFKTDSRHTTDDRITFLEAVRAASIVPEASIRPTKKMCQAIFQILREESSLELLMESFQLLNELDKRFSLVSMSGADKSILNLPSNCDNQIQLVVSEEAWSPFIFGSDSEGTSKNHHGPIDINGFQVLVEEIMKAGQTNSGISEIKALKDMMLLQYLINVLEGDFIPRNTVYQNTMNWSLLRDSLLNMILGSRRVRYKDLVQDILSIMCSMSPVQLRSAYGRLSVTSEAYLPENSDIASSLALPELRRCTCSSMQKLLVMIMELDKANKNADMNGLTTRADGVRTRNPVVEIIQDHLTYNETAVSPFLEVFTEPKCKLDIIIQYFQKYMAKPSVRTRKSNNLNSAGEATFPGILNCFCNGSITKSIRKKIHPEVIQLLLAHAFQAYLSLPAESSFESNHDSKGAFKNSVAETCKNLISAFTNLRRDGCMEILPFAKEALFTATCILSKK